MFLTREPIALNDLLSVSPDPSCGAECSFVGFVRNHDRGRSVLRLHYEAYASMAEKMIAAIILEAEDQWPVSRVRVLHRIGTLEIGEAAVLVAISAAHRDEAFGACRFVIDEIKRRVPIWKKEIFEDGSDEWVLCGHTTEVPSR